MGNSDKPRLLGINIDHIATLRQARMTDYPDVLEAANCAVRGGADGITVHLREDRRHIQEEDVRKLKESIQLPLNLEMAAIREMVAIASEISPKEVCLVPERRQELTTEGGLDVVSQQDSLAPMIMSLREAGIDVSLFVDAEPEQIEASARIGAAIIELHTGHYADARNKNDQNKELDRLSYAADLARDRGLVVNAGHGLNYDNVLAIAAMKQLRTLNIGHVIVARAVFSGLEQAVREMKQLVGSAAMNSPD